MNNIMLYVSHFWQVDYSMKILFTLSLWFSGCERNLQIRCHIVNPRSPRLGVCIIRHKEEGGGLLVGQNIGNVGICKYDVLSYNIYSILSSQFSIHIIKQIRAIGLS